MWRTFWIYIVFSYKVPLKFQHVSSGFHPFFHRKKSSIFHHRYFGSSIQFPSIFSKDLPDFPEKHAHFLWIFQIPRFFLKKKHMAGTVRCLASLQVGLKPGEPRGLAGHVWSPTEPKEKQLSRAAFCRAFGIQLELITIVAKYP